MVLTDAQKKRLDVAAASPLYRVLDKHHVTVANHLSPIRFRVEDGYVLVRGPDGWTDGDLVFDAGENGLPVYDDGEPVLGTLLED